MGTNHINTYALSIAGFDPSGGAGILADIKTFESHKVYGLGVTSALTFQNDIVFDSVKWINTNDIIKQIHFLKKRFNFSVIKIGLIKDLNTLIKITNYLVSTIPDSKIIWDPIIKASAGFEFHKKMDVETLKSILSKIYLLTPNINEAVFLANKSNPNDAANALSTYCHVLLKGGHLTENIGTDILYTKDKTQLEVILPSVSKNFEIFPKHGSGCILSSAIAANLAKGHSLTEACKQAKIYTERYLSYTNQLISFHYV